MLLGTRGTAVARAAEEHSQSKTQQSRRNPIAAEWINIRESLGALLESFRLPPRHTPKRSLLLHSLSVHNYINSSSHSLLSTFLLTLVITENTTKSSQCSSSLSSRPFSLPLWPSLPQSRKSVSFCLHSRLVTFLTFPTFLAFSFSALLQHPPSPPTNSY